MGTRRRRRIDAVLLAAVVLLVGGWPRSRRWPGGPSGSPGCGPGPGSPGRRRPDRRGDRLRLRQPGAPRHLPRRARAGPGRPGPGRLAHRPRPGRGDRHRPPDPPAHRRPRAHGHRPPPLHDRLPAGRGRPGGRLAWDAVGTSWPVGIARAELHVAAPYRLEGARCVQGGAGSAAPCRVAQPEPGHLVATVEGLDAGEGVTLYATAGTGLPAAPALPAPPPPPADPGTGPVPPALVAAAAALAGAAATSWLVRRAGRERVALRRRRRGRLRRDGSPPAAAGWTTADLAGLATVEFAPPPELTPAQGGVLLAEAVRPEHKVAWLIGAAVDGHLDLEDDGGTGDPGPAPPPRRGRHLPARLGLRGPRPPHPRGLRPRLLPRLGALVGSELDAWRQSSPLWDPAGDRRRALALILGAVAGVAGAAPDRPRRRPGQPVGAGLAGPGGGWAALLAGSGVAAAVRAWELRVRTPAGSGPVAADRVVPALPGRLGGPPRRGGGQARLPARVHRLGGRRRRARPVVAGGGRLLGRPRRPRRGPLSRAGPGLLSGSSGSSTPPSSGGSGGGGGGVGGGAGGGGGGSW